MGEWPDSFVQANDLTIHYHRSGGAGKPQIILLHGLTDNGLCWTPVARDLQADFDVLMTDARGHGQTGGPLANFSYRQLAADVATLISTLQLDRPYLWGHSMGALTAAVVAANYPTLVSAVVLEDPPFTNETSERSASDILASFQGILSLKTMAPEQRLVAARSMNPGWDEVELTPWANSKVEFDSEVFRYLEGRFPWRELLPRISCPILLVTGDPAAHAIVTPQLAQEAASLWQQGEVLQIQGAGHCIHRDRYAATLPPVVDFLLISVSASGSI